MSDKPTKLKKPSAYKPNIGKMFALRKARQISIKWTTNPRRSAPVGPYSYSKDTLNNTAGNIFALVTNEWTHDVEILYDGHRYKISKFYLLHPINDPESKTTTIDCSLQDLVKKYFNLIERNTNLPKEFVEFGWQLKQVQDKIVNTLNVEDQNQT